MSDEFKNLCDSLSEVATDEAVDLHAIELEARHKAGRRAFAMEVGALVIRELRLEQHDNVKLALLEERTRIVSLARLLCCENPGVLDNDWPDDTPVLDIIEHKLVRPLLEELEATNEEVAKWAKLVAEDGMTTFDGAPVHE